MNNSNRYFLRTAPDPILKVVCEAVEPGEPLPFIETMIRVCRHQSQGVGLAAPQIGVAKRVIVSLVGHPATYINPLLEWSSDETDVVEEMCLSYPGVKKAIRRPISIRLAYLNGRREPCVDTFNGFIARVIQHELDHLEGICRVGDEAYVGDATPQRGTSPLKAAFPLVAAVAAYQAASIDREVRE